MTPRNWMKVTVLISHVPSISTSNGWEHVFPNLSLILLSLIDRAVVDLCSYCWPHPTRWQSRGRRDGTSPCSVERMPILGSWSWRVNPWNQRANWRKCAWCSLSMATPSLPPATEVTRPFSIAPSALTMVDLEKRKRNVILQRSLRTQSLRKEQVIMMGSNNQSGWKKFDGFRINIKSFLCFFFCLRTQWRVPCPFRGRTIRKILLASVA